MARFVKMVSLKMADQLQVATVESAAAFVGVFRRYDFAEGSRGAGAGRPADAMGKWGADLFTSVPTQLLWVELRFNEEERSLGLDPAPEEVVDKVLLAFDEILVQSEGVEDVSAKLSLSMQDKTLPTGEGSP